MFKKICAMILLMVLLITSLASYTPVKAAEADKESLTQANMTAVLIEVKKKAIIPDEYTKFSYSCYENTYGGENWNFKWTTDDSADYITITCNESSNITEYYDSKASKTAREADMLPVFLSEELLGVAKEYIRIFMPDEYEKAEFAECQFSGIGSNIYNFYFNRSENGITVTDNSIRVALSAITGELVSFNTSWYFNLEIPEPENIISAEKAAEIIDSEIEMKLAYYTLTNYEPVEGDKSVKTFLAYTPSVNYLAVDAFTGEVYFTGNSITSDSTDSNGAGAEKGENSKYAGLTEAEIEKIEEFGKFIKRDDAVMLIAENEALYVEETATQITAGLYKRKSADGEEHYIWDIMFKDPRPVDYSTKDTYRFYASASLDAETGKLLSYSARVKGYYEYSAEELKNIEIKYSVEERQQIFEEFLKKEAPEKAENIVLSSHYEEYPVRFENDGTSSLYSMSLFSYVRENEGIPYSANSLYGSVNALTGKIYRYGTNWNDNVEFTATDNIISEEEAFDKYISFEGYECIYEMVYDYREGKVYPEVRLVYRTSIYPNYINAVTGKQSYLSGKEYSVQNYNYEYSDIKGHKHERAIKLLASMGIGFESSTFGPDNTITRDEFNELVKMSGYFSISDADYVTGGQKLTRQIVAKYGAIACGYGEIGKLENIFTTGCYDERTIYKGYKGYMALALGLGIIRADEYNCINPYKNYTKGEAAELLLELINIVCNN